MNIELKKVELKDKPVLNNLLEKYSYEFSQYDKKDVDDSGLYGYEYLDCYWTEENRFAYFVLADGKLAGFVMISDYPEVPELQTDYCLSEFFIMYKYRRMGIGKETAFRVFTMFHGKLQLKRHPHNIASVKFWDSVVSQYTKGNYKLIKNYPNPEVDYDDGTPADVFFFEN